MKTIIAGSRTITDYQAVKNAIEWSGFKITEVVSGHCRGVDLLGERWAKENKIPVKTFEVTQEEWKALGKSAGPIRNAKMAVHGEQLIAIQEGQSSGTAHMIKLAKSKKIPIFLLSV